MLLEVMSDYPLVFVIFHVKRRQQKPTSHYMNIHLDVLFAQVLRSTVNMIDHRSLLSLLQELPKHHYFHQNVLAI